MLNTFLILFKCKYQINISIQKMLTRYMIFMNCLDFMISSFLMVFLKNVLFNGLVKWLYVQELAKIKGLVLVVLNYLNLYLNLELRINLNKLFFIKWYMLFFLLLILKLVLLKEVMVNSSSKLWIILILSQN